MSFLVGGASASVLALLDLLVVRRYRLTLRSLHWWGLRLFVDGLQGAAAIILVHVAALQVAGFSTPVVWVLTGAFSTKVIQSLQYSGGTKGFHIDLRNQFDRLTLPLNEELANSTAAANASKDRRLSEALAKGGVTPGLLARELIATMQARVALSTKWEDGEYLKETAANGSSEEERLRVLVARAREIQLLGTVKSLIRSTRMRWWRRLPLLNRSDNRRR